MKRFRLVIETIQDGDEIIQGRKMKQPRPEDDTYRPEAEKAKIRRWNDPGRRFKQPSSEDEMD